jgi:protein SCO1/2
MDGLAQSLRVSGPVGGSMGHVRCAKMKRLAIAFFALAISVGFVSKATAQGYSADKPMGAMAQQLPAYLAQAGLEQRLGQMLPMTTTFTDETGRNGELKSWFDDKPVVMALVYYKCAMLCPQVLHGLEAGLKETTLTVG